MYIAEYIATIKIIMSEFLDLIIEIMTLNDVLRSEPVEGARIFSRRSTTCGPSGRTAGDVLH